MLVCFHDFTSLASAVAVRRLQRLADGGAAIAFEGFDVLGVDVTIPVTLDVLSDWERHRDAAVAEGFDVRRPRRQPPTLAAHLVGDVAESLGLGAAWRTACYAAYWERGVDLADRAALVDVAVSAGLARHAVTSALDDPVLRRDVRRRVTARRGEGVGGVPVLHVDGALVPALMPEDDLRTLAALHSAG